LDVLGIRYWGGGILLRKDHGLYRPTVRYEVEFKDYIEELFRATGLDRNTLFRAALFFFGEGLSKQFLLQHLKKDKQLPLPLRDRVQDHEFFMKNLEIHNFIEGGRDVPLIQEGGTSVIVKSKGIKLIVRSDQG
jgi:hypothetical protein